HPGRHRAGPGDGRLGRRVVRPRPDAGDHGRSRRTVHRPDRAARPGGRVRAGQQRSDPRRAAGTAGPVRTGCAAVRIRGAVLVALAVAATAVVTAPVAGADPAEPGNYDSHVLEVTPPTDAITAKVVGGDG